MTIKIICEDHSRRSDYIEHIVNNCMKIKELPMKLVLLFDGNDKEDQVEQTQFIEIGEQAKEEKVFTESNPLTHEETWERTGVIESSGLVIDLLACRVWVNKEERFLSKKEFSILAYLAKNPNRVCSKDEILENVWYPMQKKSQSTLMVHMKNLREKIEVNHRYPRRLETVRGVGYRFNKD